MDGVHAQLCLTPWDPMVCSPPGSSVHGISRKNIGVGCHFLLQGIFLTQELNLHLLHLLHQQAILYHWRHLKQWKCVSHSVLADALRPADCSLPGSSVHGILQARILQWVALPSPGDLPNSGIELGSPALQADSLPSEPSGKWWKEELQQFPDDMILYDTEPPHNNY